jgi:hypothetical protein
MPRNLRINFYEVQKCGYFRRADDTPYLCDSATMLGSLHKWISYVRPTVRETQTFTPHEDANHLPVYCYSIVSHTISGDYLLTTWNESEQAEGRVASVHADEETGQARIDAFEVADNALPGYPAYFWFISDHNLIASIRLDTQRLGGHPGMVQYITGYLERFSPWVVLPTSAERTPNVQVLGYRDNGDIRHDLKPRFLSAPVRLQGEIEYIRKNRRQIRKIIRTDEYGGGPTRQTPLLRKMLQSLGLRDAPEELDATRFRFELDFEPTRMELNEVIEAWQDRSNSEDATRWDDVGFKFEADPTVRWLSRSVAKQTLELDIHLRDEVLIEAETLMTALQRRREDLLERVLVQNE